MQTTRAQSPLTLLEAYNLLTTA